MPVKQTGDKRTISDYDTETTDLLLGIAADVLCSFGTAFGGHHIAIVGGLVPTLLGTSAITTTGCVCSG